MDKRWKPVKMSVYTINYYVIWTPKYKRKVLINGVEIELERLLREKAKKDNWKIKYLEINSNFIIMFVEANPLEGVHSVLLQFKKYTYNRLREMFPELKKKIPSLWTRSYYAETVGKLSKSEVKEFVKEKNSSPRVLKFLENQEGL